MSVNTWFETLQRDYIEQEGTRLLALEQTWHDRVPEQLDRAVERTVKDAHSRAEKGLPILLLPTYPWRRSGRVTSRVALRGAALGLAGVAAVSAGAYKLAESGARQAEPAPSAELTRSVAERTAREPEEYSIPSPGEDYSLVEEAEGSRVRYAWFRSGEREILVELLFYAPEQPEPAEPIQIGPLSGTLSESNIMQTLTLRDQTLYLVLQSVNVEREALLAYAAALVEANP